MNDPYHWHAERMVDLEMKEIRREVAQANLLREAGLSRTSLLARAAKALHRLLQARREKVQERHSPEHESYLLSEKTDCQS
jgi:hypothetical protein